MTPSARLSAAIEVLADIDARRRPAVDALKDWGLAHRFAGSGDRAAIASTGMPRSCRSMPSRIARGVSAPMIQPAEALRRSAS